MEKRQECQNIGEVKLLEL